MKRRDCGCDVLTDLCNCVERCVRTERGERKIEGYIAFNLI